MSSYRQILYHIVFRTYGSGMTLPLEHTGELYAYIGGIIKNKNCFLYQINGMQEHIHILSDLHPNIALADYIRDIKTASSFWLKRNPNFSGFNGWSEGYAALTYAYGDLDIVGSYIINQREHHAKVNFLDEYKKLLEEHQIVIDEKYFP